MDEKNYRRSLLAAALLLMVLFCLGQAVTTKDLLLAGNQNSVPITTFAGTGAVNQPPSAKSLTPDIEGPQTAGNMIIWTANAYDPDGDKLLYQFWLNGPLTGNTWKPMTSWNESNTWNWTTSPIDSGNNVIDVHIRDGRHAAPWGSDSHISAEYNIKNIEEIGGGRANIQPSLLNLKSDRQSPQDLGVKVIWTAKASDPDKDTILYQYVLKGPSTGDQWVPVSIWTTDNVWKWDTAQTKAGIYLIEVRIRDGYHADVENSDDSKNTAYILKQKGVIK